MKITYISLRITVIVHLSFFKAVFSCGLIAAWKNRPKRAPNTLLENNTSIKLLNVLVCYSSIKLLYQIVNFLVPILSASLPLLFVPCHFHLFLFLLVWWEEQQFVPHPCEVQNCVLHMMFWASCEHQSQMAASNAAQLIFVLWLSQKFLPVRIVCDVNV